jgi:7-cyano-7-deazaguanine reductase
MREIPLGKSTGYSDEYAPELLFAVARADARAAAGIGPELPFRGRDIWNAWELTWLDASGKPVVATAMIAIDATSPHIVESKSLKLYLNSLAMTRYTSSNEVAALIAHDLSAVACDDVVVTVTPAEVSTDCPTSGFRGSCIDQLSIGAVPIDVDANLLHCEDDIEVTEELYSHLLRSSCPVTGQPDMGSVLIRYRGPKIDRQSLLTYIVSYRQHNDFHEACVERMFLDIKKHCSPKTLSVYARYNRRGGLDINPFRTNTNEIPDNLRLWRQ